MITTKCNCGAIYEDKNKINITQKVQKRTTKQEQKARAALSLRNEASSGDLDLLLYIFFHKLKILDKIENLI